ncbi:MAG: rhomboid family intramembrane serine protease [Spirochaetales bacterium]|nr:rhomboid family intramembrane serine protease [Leptospiraceae bacterium]MCP5482088.1 rhomboid family intramembrane serine protease [Spirochaetales bacterium]MCP5484956.1 rhomboid family intramembrane serine protease [Spirochaetales bacterium]
MQSEEQLRQDSRALRRAAWTSIAFVLLLWVLFLIELATGFEAFRLGIYPRRPEAISGILFAPLIHADAVHLLSNSLPLFVLGCGTLYLYRRVALPVLLFIYLGGGLAIWLFARPSYHIGASGLTYGMAAFIFFCGVLRRDPPAIALALIVTFLYGAMIWGLFPIERGVSWESHLFSALAGAIAAFAYRLLLPPEPEAPDMEAEE